MSDCFPNPTHVTQTLPSYPPSPSIPKKTTSTMAARYLAVLALFAATTMAQPASTSSGLSQSSTPSSTSVTHRVEHGLAEGAKIGIGVGVAVAVLAVLGFLLCGYLLFRRHNKKAQKESYSEYHEPTQPEKPVRPSKPAPQYRQAPTQPQNTFSHPSNGTHVASKEMSQPAQYARNEATSYNPPAGVATSDGNAADMVQGGTRTAKAW